MPIYIAGQDISAFGARLRQDYTISGAPISPTLRQGKNDSQFFLLDRSDGLLTVTLPLDFYGKNVPEIAQNMAKLRGLCHELVEVSLGDGFRYRLCLTDIGVQEWTEDVLCSQTLTFQGQRLGEPLCVTGTAPLVLHNPGTWSKTACRVTFTGFQPTGANVTIALRQGNIAYLTWRINNSADYSGGDLVLDGIEKVNSYAGSALPRSTMTWTEYPWLHPGECTLTAFGCTFTEARVEWQPAYL